MITETEKQKLEAIYQNLLHDERILKMKEIPMHNGSNCYLHTFKVVKGCFKRAIRKKDIDYETLLYACVFHDYYLYDWRKHKEFRKGHGKNHPQISINNAKKDFQISDAAAEIISSHMWPINFKNFPHSKEAKILCDVDTMVATGEFLTSKKHKAKKEAKYLEEISRLFD